MNTVRQQLDRVFAEGFVELGLPEAAARIYPSERPELAHFQCNGALQAAKALEQSPLKVAETIVGHLQPALGWAHLSVAGPGFVNVVLGDEYLAEQLNLMLRDERLGCAMVERPKRLCLDFGGPNLAKPLHVGHLRSGIIGDSLQRLNRFVGHTVTSDVHLGDWGTQMGMVICGIRREQPELPYFDEGFSGPYPDVSPVSVSDLERIYPVQSSLCKADGQEMAAALLATRELQAGRPGYRALWQHFMLISVASAKAMYDRLGIHFDLWDGESTVNDRIPPMLEKLRRSGQAVMSEGALIIPLSSPPPLLLEKSDGAYLYATTDLATLEARLERGETAIHYVVDKRQELHFRQLFEAAHLTHMVSDDIDLQFHGYGTANGPDGKPFKSRDGGVMRLEELIRLVEVRAAARLDELEIAKEYPQAEREQIVQDVATASLKFADLINNKTSDYSFDLDRFTSFEGKTGPYLLYTAVRARSVLRTAGPLIAEPWEIAGISEFERSLLVLATGLPETVAGAATASAPHLLCEYAFRISQEYNRFYQRCNILHDADPDRQRSWLAITRLLLLQLELLCGLIGLPVPERM